MGPAMLTGASSRHDTSGSASAKAYALTLKNAGLVRRMIGVCEDDVIKLYRMGRIPRAVDTHIRGARNNIFATSAS